MSRKWDQYGGGPSRTKRGATYVSMSPKGMILMNREMFEQWGEPEAAFLLYEHETDTIGVKPASPLMPDVFHVSEKKGSRHRLIHALPFIRKHNLQFDAVVRFPTASIEDGILLLDLRKMAPAARGPRKRH